AGQGVREEEAQEGLVAQLDPRVRAGEPAVERRRPRGGDPVDAAGSAAAGRVVAGDPARGLEPAQIGIDLAVAGGPEMADRAIDRPLEVVAAARLLGDQPEDRPGGLCGFHISSRYITVIHTS